MVRTATARLHLQPGEKVVLLVEAVTLIAVAFIVLLAW